MSEDSQIRVLSVDDHPLMHEGISFMINSQPDMLMVAEASNGKEGLAQFVKHRPDITLMDLRLPDMSGIEAMAHILKDFRNARIIILTTSEGDVEIQRALKAGAFAYLLKTTPSKELAQVIRKVHSGKKHIPSEIAASLAEHLSDESLTKREVSVLQLIGGGNRNRDIANQLCISEETVKVHIAHIMSKLAASDRTEAVSIGIRRGIIRL